MDKSGFDPTHATVGELLRKIRLEAKLRQVDVANRLGLPQSFVSKYESGERRLEFVEVAQICAALGIRFSAFVQRFEGGA